MNPKIIFLTLGTKGDLFPFLGIAREMKSRGFNTLILTSEPYRPDCEKAGVPMESILSREQSERVINDPRLWTPVGGLIRFLRDAIVPSLQPAFSAIEREAKRGPVVVVYNSLLFAGAAAGEALGVPTVSVFIQPYAHPSSIDPAQESPFFNFALRQLGVSGRRVVMNAMLQYFNRHLSGLHQFRRDLGLAPVHDPLWAGRANAPFILDLWPEWFCPGKADWPTHARRCGFVEYDGNPNLGAGVAPPPPQPANAAPESFLHLEPIVFTLGTEMRIDLAAHIKMFSNACRRLAHPGVFVTSFVPEQKVSEHFHIGNWPYAKIFPRAAAVLSHGGIGTVARAFKCGKPQVITPQAFDHFDNGFHVARLNAGVSLPFRSLREDDLVSALRHVLSSPRVLESCLQIASRSSLNAGAEFAADAIQSRLPKGPHLREVG